jgi:hypothetical protein
MTPCAHCPIGGHVNAAQSGRRGLLSPGSHGTPHAGPHGALPLELKGCPNGIPPKLATTQTASVVSPGQVHSEIRGLLVSRFAEGSGLHPVPPITVGIWLPYRPLTSAQSRHGAFGRLHATALPPSPNRGKPPHQRAQFGRYTKNFLLGEGDEGTQGLLNAALGSSGGRPDWPCELVPPRRVAYCSRTRGGAADADSGKGCY